MLFQNVLVGCADAYTRLVSHVSVYVIEHFLDGAFLCPSVICTSVAHAKQRAELPFAPHEYGTWLSMLLFSRTFCNKPFYKANSQMDALEQLLSMNVFNSQHNNYDLYIDF